MERDIYHYLVSAAIHSRFHARHWFRYLRKVIFEDRSLVSEEDLNKLLKSEDLTNFQKISLKYALQPGSPTWEHVVSLNKKGELKNVKELLRRYKIG